MGIVLLRTMVVLLMLIFQAGMVQAAKDTVAHHAHLGCGDAVNRNINLPLFPVTQYGGVGDGKTINTLAFQKAFAAASAAGGGIVLVSNGRYLSGTIELLSNTYLEVDQTALIIGSTNIEDYQWSPATNMPAVVYAQGKQNVGIMGLGVIDGNALPGFIASYSKQNDEFSPIMWTGLGPYNCSAECRPRLVEIVQCDNVLVKDITLQNSPDWTSHYLGCTNVLISNIIVTGDYRWPNNDGIDPDSSINVTIEGVNVNTGDDGVCPKSTGGYGNLENLYVTNSILRS
eukprot:PhF_6_TR33629/c0_g1_i3/m.49130